MRKQEKALIVVAVIDVLSIIVKFFLAVLTGSLSLLADAWHSMADLATTIMVFVALVMDRREKVATGLEDTGRVRIIRRSSWEPRVCILIGIALTGVAAGVFKKVYKGSDLADLNYPLVALLIVLFLILLSYIRFRFEESVGKETDSPALIADAYHSKVDIYVLTMILISLAGELVQLRIDRWVAGLIAIMILSIALKTLFNAFSVMLKQSHDTPSEKRSVEDVVIMLMMGYLFSKQTGLISRMAARLGMTDPVRGRFVRFRVARAALLTLGVLWLCSGLYTVRHDEVAVVERLGRPVNMLNPAGPGIHIDWPAPFSVVRRVNLTQVRWMRLGYQTQERKDIILWTNAHYIKEYSVLTGDSAIVDLAANMHYRIRDPDAFLYAAVDPEEKLRMIADDALRHISGKRSLFDLLAFQREICERETIERIQDISDEANLGFEILQVCFLDVHPPMEVAPSFEDVVSAQEDLEAYVEQAYGYQKESLPGAYAEAFDRLKQAEGYEFDVVEKAKGRSVAFAAASTAFNLHKQVNRRRLYLDSLADWMAGSPLWIVDPLISKQMPDLLISKPADPVKTPNTVGGGEMRIENE